MIRQQRWANCRSLLLILTLLLAGLPVRGVPAAQSASITIHGIKEAAWGDLLVTDPRGEMSEPNLNLADLYVVESADSLYIGLDAYASTWGMAYGIYLDTEQLDGSAVTSDPWSRAIGAVSAHRPKRDLYVYYTSADALQSAEPDQ